MTSETDIFECGTESASPMIDSQRFILREEAEASFVQSGFITSTYRFQAGGLTGARLSSDAYKELMSRQELDPVVVMKHAATDRVWWMYQGSFYCEEEGCNADEVKAITRFGIKRPIPVGKTLLVFPSTQVKCSEALLPLASMIDKELNVKRAGGMGLKELDAHSLRMILQLCVNALGNAVKEFVTQLRVIFNGNPVQVVFSGDPEITDHHSGEDFECSVNAIAKRVDELLRMRQRLVAARIETEYEPVVWIFLDVVDTTLARMSSTIKELHFQIQGFEDKLVDEGSQDPQVTLDLDLTDQFDRFIEAMRAFETS